MTMFANDFRFTTPKNLIKMQWVTSNECINRLWGRKN